MPSETVEMRGHIIDSLLLPKVLDEIVEAGCDFEIVEFSVGRTHRDPSYARIRITSPTQPGLEEALRRVHPQGALPEAPIEAILRPAPADGVFPEGFYSTTNLPTEVRLGTRWVAVKNPEMDCGVVVEDSEARTKPMSDVASGEMVVVGRDGIRVSPVERPRGRQEFEFMASDVSSEKPKELLVEKVAAEMRRSRQAGRRILWVLGPAVIHTGSGPAFAELAEGGWVDVVFAGNGLAAHDIESSMFATSLGVYLREGTLAEGGHEHHIRAINAVRRAGSIAEAVDQGIIESGVMFTLVKQAIPFVLAGSVRDDGPLPDTETDVVVAQRRMRELVEGVGLTIVIATMLHGIATGNLLPAAVPIVCVDINPSTVTKLLDRGSHQSAGIVTDVGLFLRHLASVLH